ncbi:MAG TPA: hypothetical protein VE871_06300 [Longimicrobium sp.]|nr:hypothetical protein [Longimicrobium sp.]
MKKIHLDLDTLDVVSFSTTGTQESARGTVHGQNRTTDSFFTLGGHDSCYGMCNTMEYHTCGEPSVGPSCENYCTAQSVGCYPPEETELCG